MPIRTTIVECCREGGKGMARRKISEMQTRVRQRYEGQLKTIEPLSDLARKLLSQEGFLDLFLEVRML